jgi:hypothetical protein
MDGFMESPRTLKTFLIAEHTADVLFQTQGTFQTGGSILTAVGSRANNSSHRSVSVGGGSTSASTKDKIFPSISLVPYVGKSDGEITLSIT